MFLNMSSVSRLSESALTPNDLSSGRAGGGGPFFSVVCRAGCETVRVFWEPGLAVSTPSGTVPTLFFLPNQLLLFLRVNVGAWLFIVAGEPGRSDLKLSLDGSDRRPRNFRTDEGRRCVGLVGDSMLLAASLVREGCSCSMSSPDDSPCALPFGAASLGKAAALGVGCDERGPLPGVGGRGVSGGESGGAGIEVPSVREKLMGVSVSGFHLPTAMAGDDGRLQWVINWARARQRKRHRLC